MSQALNDAPDSGGVDTPSVLSKRSQRSKGEGWRSQVSDMMVESAQRTSAESVSSISNAVVADAWPLAIIKTVSVEIVEEDAPNIAQDSDKGGSRSAGKQQDWDSYLR